MSQTRVGQEIGGKYRLVRLLGEGGMGAVYEAQHTLIGRRFAIKFLHSKLADSPDILARFRREAQAAGSLECENIAAVTDFGSADDGAPYIVMEYLIGEDLSRLLSRQGPMPVPRLVDLVIQACRGLHAAHSAGIVHRDLKPENLFVARRSDGADLVKVLDFGIAKLRTVEGEASSTRTGTTMGTPFYMSPEQARGDKEVDQRADVYALGVILYEALSGAKPHPGESYNAILYHILSRPAAPLESLRPGLPAGLAAIVHRALAFEPNDRHASVAELTSALTPHAGRPVTPIQFYSAPEGSAASGAPTVETPPSVVGERAATEVAVPPAEPTPMPAVPMRRGKAAFLVGLAAAAVGLGAGTLLVSKKERPESVSIASASVVTSVAAASTIPAPPSEPLPTLAPTPGESSAPTSASVPPPSTRASTRSSMDRSFVRSASVPSRVEGHPSTSPSATSVKAFVGDRR